MLPKTTSSAIARARETRVTGNSKLQTLSLRDSVET